MHKVSKHITENLDDMLLKWIYIPEKITNYDSPQDIADY